MLELIIFSLIPLALGLIKMRARLELTWSFCISALISSVAAVSLNPLLVAEIQQRWGRNFLPLEWQNLAVLLTVTLGGLLILWIFFSLFAPARNQVDFPVKLYGILNFIFCFVGMSALMGVVALGLSSHPLLDNLPGFNQERCNNYGKQVNELARNLLGLHQDMAPEAEIWLTCYPQHIYQVTSRKIPPDVEVKPEATTPRAMISPLAEPEKSQESDFQALVNQTQQDSQPAPATSSADTEGTFLNKIKKRLPVPQTIEEE